MLLQFVNKFWIDELVVQAFKCKGTEAKEVESFTNFLSEILSSMKPWVPRLHKSLSTPVESTVNEVESVEVESPQGSLISPSPLVSWNADCTIERGRRLFKHTPLPISKSLSSKPPIPSKSCLRENFFWLALIGSTPIWKEAESVVRTGKCPGQNTLKRELWTKFEAASSNELLFNDFVTHKGFLDRLDKVS
ncbi:uncharacterized protein Pyn_13089 [Prunus yedoensis var. nudiflora]|uniref:Uncharacterized protein n=1 Tax=Prunus yedoensis var. nudiflora TaxID=2094558 RepID=A0A314XK33_PRUYE|nr:uncharacterized protein Pyn_13089 [Prunus yedoensis var. nudiflora]